MESPVADKEAEKKEEEKEGEKPAEGAEGDAPAKKGLSKKLIIIIAAATVLILGGGGGAAFFLLHGKSEEAKPGTEAANAQTSDEKGKPIYFPLGDLLVNLSGEGKHPNFLKVKVTLELSDEKDVPLMEAIKPRIIDNFQVYLRELRIEDLRGSAGMYRLREELLTRVTEAAQPVRVRDVLFQEMLVQ
jgi:flagellar FliL protein